MRSTYGKDLFEQLVRDEIPEALVGKLTGMLLTAAEGSEWGSRSSEERDEGNEYLRDLIDQREFRRQETNVALCVLSRARMLTPDGCVVPSIFDPVRVSVREKFRVLHFRRVVETYTRWKTRWLVFPDKRQFLRNQKVDPGTWNQYGEERAVAFRGRTSTVALRENDQAPGEALYFRETGTALLDPFSFELKPNPSSVVPAAGDLVCGVVGTSRSGRRLLSRWFICSEQFLRCWTLCMYPDHPSFELIKAKKKNPLAYWMSGNRLMTNSFLKWILSETNGGRSIHSAEARRRYFHSRTEPASILWVHVYCALVLVVRYCEPPSLENAPRIGGAAQAWNLPVRWLSTLLTIHAKGFNT